MSFRQLPSRTQSDQPSRAGGRTFLRTLGSFSGLAASQPRPGMHRGTRCRSALHECRQLPSLASLSPHLPFFSLCSGLRTLPLFPAVAAAGQSSLILSCQSVPRPSRVVASSAARGAAVLWALVCVCMRRQQCRWRPSLSSLNLISSLLCCSGLRTLPLFPAVAAAGQSSSPPSFYSLGRHRAMPACREAPRRRRYSSAAAVSRGQQ